MSLSKNATQHKHLLFAVFAERRKRLTALAWILAQKTQMSGGYTCYKNRYGTTRSWDTWFPEGRGAVYSMDTDRAQSVLSLLTNYLMVSYSEQIIVPFYKSVENLLPWIVNSKIRWFITPTLVSKIFTKEALNSEYRMFRTFEQIHQNNYTSGFPNELKTPLSRGHRHNKYNEIEDWRAGLKNGEVIAQLVPHHRWQPPGSRPRDGVGDLVGDIDGIEYPALPESGYYYSDVSPTRIIDDEDEQHMYHYAWGWAPPRVIYIGRGHLGDPVLPWWKRKHDTFYKMARGEVIWGAGPEALIWKKIFIKKTEMYPSIQLASDEIDLNTPHTELSYRKASGFYTCDGRSQEFLHPRIIEAPIRGELCGHSFNRNTKCEKCVANTIRIVGIEKSKNHRTECIYSYSSDSRIKIKEVLFRDPHISSYSSFTDIPPIKKTKNKIFARQKKRKQKSLNTYSVNKVNRRIRKSTR